ncbi:MAG: hypothetical protein K6A74_02125 [Lachnospiraceae bacterium]|nr:hypothetical protein [Lachnospiraceae bacterium]
MKKKLFGLLLAAFTCGTMVMGASAAETADEIMAKYKEASAAVEEVSATVDMNADIQLSMEGQTFMSLTGNAAMNVAVDMDPLAIMETATMTGNMEMGGEGSQGGSLNMTMYMQPDENGAFAIYAGVDMGEGIEWMKQAMGEEETAKLMEMIEQAKSAQMPDLPVAFELAAEGADVNGTDCYVLNATLTWTDLMNVLTTVIEQNKDQLPEEVVSQIPDAETLNMVGAMFSGLKFNIQLSIAKDTYLPMRAYIDMEGSDWVTLGAVVGSLVAGDGGEGSAPNIGLDVNSLYMDYVYDYSTPVEIVVPDDVKAAAQDMGEMGDYGELVEELESEF